MSEGRDALLAEARDYLKAMCPAATEQDINVALNQFVSTADGKEFALALQTHIQQKALADLHCKPGQPPLKESVLPDTRVQQVPMPQTGGGGGETVTYNYYGNGDVSKRNDNTALLQALRALVPPGGNATGNNNGVPPNNNAPYAGTIAHEIGGGRDLTPVQAAQALQRIAALDWEQNRYMIPEEHNALQHYVQWMEDRPERMDAEINSWDRPVNPPAVIHLGPDESPLPAEIPQPPPELLVGRHALFHEIRNQRAQFEGRADMATNEKIQVAQNKLLDIWERRTPGNNDDLKKEAEAVIKSLLDDGIAYDDPRLPDTFKSGRDQVIRDLSNDATRDLIEQARQHLRNIDFGADVPGEKIRRMRAEVAVGSRWRFPELVELVEQATSWYQREEADEVLADLKRARGQNLGARERKMPRGGSGTSTSNNQTRRLKRRSRHWNLKQWKKMSRSRLQDHRDHHQDHSHHQEHHHQEHRHQDHSHHQDHSRQEHFHGDHSESDQWTSTTSQT